MTRGAVFLVDDDSDLLTATADWLEVSGFAVRAFPSARSALSALEKEAPDLVVTDIRMPGMDGLGFLAAIRERHPALPVVMMTGHGDVPLAVNAMRQGAEDFLEKPIDADHLVAVLDRAVGKTRLHQEIHRLQQSLQESREAGGLLGDSPGIRDLRDRIRALADIDVDVLVIGETGTGKELVARALHEQGRRAAGPFVAVNCAAVPESIFESEIFGHAKGAFTGAQQDRTGKFEHAAGGTIFLDEMESMPSALQAKILRTLQERNIERLGEIKLRPLDVRVIAAVKSVRSADHEGSLLRRDLYYRLASVELVIPPLRRRGGDIALLFTHFATLAAARYGRPLPAIDDALLRRLETHGWPGNVRELKAAAERHALGIGDAAMPDAAALPLPGETLAERIDEFEAAEIRKALDACGGRTADAADRLGLPRRTLADRMARHGIRR
ncbi:MAG: sigma-54 dependent transcriptional regulator [Rhodospirillales bacterium]